MITLAASMKEPHAPTVNSTGVNAFEYLARDRQSAHLRAQIISPSDLLGWRSANTVTGDLGLQLQAFLEHCGAVYSASTTQVARKRLFLRSTGCSVLSLLS